MLVAAATFIARERCIVGGLARYRATTYRSPRSDKQSSGSRGIMGLIQVGVNVARSSKKRIL